MMVLDLLDLGDRVHDSQPARGIGWRVPDQFGLYFRRVRNPTEFLR